MNTIIISELPCSSWAKKHAANNRVSAIWEGGETCGTSQQPPLRAAGVPTAAPVGIGVRVQGISVPGELHEAAASRAWDEQSRTGFWKSCCSLLPSKKPPTLAWLDTNDNFFVPFQALVSGLGR